MQAVETLQKAGVRITPQELDELMTRVLVDIVRISLPLNPRDEMTGAAAAALERGGLSLEPLSAMGPDDPIIKTAALYAGLIAASLTVTQASGILGVGTSRIRQELYNHTIYGIKDVGGWRLPNWQFNDEMTGLLPGVRRVLPHIDRHLHPVGVYRWFTSPHPDLFIDEDEEVVLSPRDWLRTGRSSETVAELADALGVGQ